MAKSTIHKGRGALSTPDVRYQGHTRESYDDGWAQVELAPQLTTMVNNEVVRSIISRNQSPDVPHSQSINPYRGCEHGCVYCFARPTHAYLDLSPGLDFESRLFAKGNAAEVLRATLRKKNYQCEPIALGANTDPYQPIEREYRITRQLLEVLWEHRHPVGIITKSSLVERDIDLLQRLASEGLVKIFISVTTMDRQLARSLEPRAAAPQRRLQTIHTLAQAGIPVGALVAPIIPVLNDSEIESILQHVCDAGATQAGYVMLRLPLEVRDLFVEWLHRHYPLKAEHVMSRMRALRGGEDYDATFGTRMTGSGEFAELIAKRFHLTCRRLGINQRHQELNCTRFTCPAQPGDQISLF